jgi:hypothetical protein
LFNLIEAVVHICVLQIEMALEWQRKIKSSWTSLVEMENGIDNSTAIDNFINIRLEIKNVYSETIQWDLSN